MPWILEHVMLRLRLFAIKLLQLLTDGLHVVVEFAVNRLIEQPLEVVLFELAFPLQEGLLVMLDVRHVGWDDLAKRNGDSRLLLNFGLALLFAARLRPLLHSLVHSRRQPLSRVGLFRRGSGCVFFRVWRLSIRLEN